jgi:NTP pyrophosphatase (non-canonical NTP hydrolase)
MLKPATMRDLFERLLVLNTRNGSGLELTAMKVSEEVGEFHAAILQLTGRKRAKGLSKATLRTEAMREGADVLIATLGTLMCLDVDYDSLLAVLREKTDTFESRIIEREAEG